MKLQETSRTVKVRVELEPGQALLEATHWFFQTQSNDAAEVASLELELRASSGNNNEAIIANSSFHATVRSLKNAKATDNTTIRFIDLPALVADELRILLLARMEELSEGLVWG